MDGGRRVAEVLATHGVRALYTLIGGHISPILVGARKVGLRVIDVRDERSAVFAADAHARLSGRVGCAVVTAGPGVTNTLTALKNAQLAHSPVVLIGGATATLLRGRGALQDIDQVAVVRPHVKHVERPARLREVVPALERALRIAQEGVPGPVFVELAVDLLYPEATVRSWYARQLRAPATVMERLRVAYVEAHLERLFRGAELPVFLPPPLPSPVEPHPGWVTKAAAMLTEARRPVLVLGSPVMRQVAQHEELVAAVESIGAPVYLSGMARGLLGVDHPLQFRHRRRAALREADLVLLAGVPADFRLDYGAHLGRARVIGLHHDAAALRLNRRPDVGIVADPHTGLVRIAGALGRSPDRAGWFETLREREAEREREIAAMAEQPVEGVNPLAFFQVLDRALGSDVVLIGDGGDFVATCSYVVRPRGPLGWLDPGVFGTLGVGGGFALGAGVVRPSAEVWLIYGDGAAGFSLIEFDTMVRHGIPCIAVVGNDAAWTQIMRDQVPLLGDDVGCRLARTAYHRVAEGLGAKGICVTEPEAVEDAIHQAQTWASEGSPVVLDVHIGPTRFREGSISI